MKIAIVGMGSIGRRHYGILRQMFPESEITCSDISDEYVSADDICHRDFDLAVICTPTSSHIDSCLLFENTSAFFIEKPLDSDLEKIRNNIGFFKDKKTMVSCNLFFSIHMEKVKRNLPNCVFADVKYHSYLPMWRPNGEYLDLYSRYKSLGGGIINDAIHEIHYVVQILGMPDSIRIDRKRLKDYTHDTEDYGNIYLEYSDKVIRIELSYLCKDKHRSCDMTLKSGDRVFVDFSGGKDLPDMHTVSDIDETYRRQWEYFFSSNDPVNNIKESLVLLEALESK